MYYRCGLCCNNEYYKYIPKSWLSNLSENYLKNSYQLDNADIEEIFSNYELESNNKNLEKYLKRERESLC